MLNTKDRKIKIEAGQVIDVELNNIMICPFRHPRLIANPATAAPHESCIESCAAFTHCIAESNQDSQVRWCGAGDFQIGVLDK